MEENITLSTILLLIEKYTKELLIACLAFAAIGYGIYHFHQSRLAKIQAESSSLFETFEELERAYSSTGDWKEVEIAAKTGLQSYKGSSLSPYFMVVQAQALAQQGQHEQAVDLLNTAIAALPKDLVLRYLFQTTQSQIKLDSGDQDLKNQAVNELTALSQDSKNIFNDKAMYLLMQHYKTQGDTLQANAAAAQLQALSQHDKEPSPWAQLIAADYKD